MLVIDILDQRKGQNELTAALTLWRIAPGNASGAKIAPAGDCVVLHQVFKEGDFYNQYAIALGASGTKVTAEMADISAGVLRVAAQASRATIFAALAVSREPNEDVVEKALAEVARAKQDGFAALLAEHTAWWHAFWARLGTYVYFKSLDREAEYVENIWWLSLYQTASSSRGAYPPKFNGSIWLADCDTRKWGGQFWVWNTETLYFPLFAANAIELTDPIYKMYWAKLPKAKAAARQRWGVGGAWFKETDYFDGPLTFALNAEQEKELADWLTGKRADLSDEIKSLDRDGSQGLKEKYSHTSHIFSSGSELAMLFWRRWAYTHDQEWLRTKS